MRRAALYALIARETLPENDTPALALLGARAKADFLVKPCRARGCVNLRCGKHCYRISGKQRCSEISRRSRALPIAPGDAVASIVNRTNNLPFGRTDCALPMLYALENRLAVDVFVVYTDNETWSGAIHPVEALRTYRERTGIPAKLVVAGLTSTGFTIADPNDAGTLDIVGFDSAAPTLIANFSRRPAASLS
jgi:hypothetical protein